MGNIPKRVAITYDWVDKWGGAEQILLALREVFPDAPLYTLFYKPQKAPWAKIFKIKASFLQYLSFLPRQILIVFAPLAFESFNFSDYDLVISVSSSFAHGIVTKCPHYHICLTPARYLYLNNPHYSIHQIFRPLENIIKKYLISWDRIAIHRPDKIFAISKTVQKRISGIWHLESEILYPPVKAAPTSHTKAGFFLYFGRLEAYKNPVLITQIFNKLNLPLVVAGTGNLLFKIKNMAHKNIQVLGEVPEDKKWEILSKAKALIFFHEEDFGIVPVEAQACGTPVIGLNRGGVAETVVDGKTGVLIDDLSPKTLSDAIINFDPKKYHTSDLIAQANRFSYESFIRTCSMWR